MVPVDRRGRNNRTTLAKATKKAKKAAQLLADLKNQMEKDKAKTQVNKPHDHEIDRLIV
jgi:ABC-type Fe3+-hydroxamate transport system substrate-binding protein